ncbi:MAG: diguanylate cyclase [Candidatus Latescibacteria bacterium]|nr:diguanylate cyclase [Candidatus Latescibacterota bacterium]
MMPAHILVVDDDHDIRALLQEFLAYRGYAVDTAESGKEALEQISGREWDLVISDLRLGDLSGFEVLTETKRRYPTSELIILTGFGSVEHAMTATDLGVSAYLQKPVILGELDIRVESALSRRRFSLKTKELLEVTGSLDDGTVQQHFKKMIDLYDFSKRLLSTVEYEDIIQQVLHCLMVLFTPQGGFVYLALDSDRTFYTHTHHPIASEVMSEVLERVLTYWRQFDGGTPSADRVTIVPSHETDMTSLESTYGTIDPVCAPLAGQNRLMGVVGVDGVSDTLKREDVITLLYMVGGQATTAVDRASRYHHIKLLSLTDGLTRLLNRRALNDRLQQEFDRTRRYGSCLSLMMLDIDHFKDINDTYGHQQGDVILRGLADILTEGSRRSDVLARYGGEEFMVVLPETTLSNARQLAERLRVRVASHPFRLPAGQLLTVTISIGVATFPRPEITDEEKLIEAADRALYRAKHGGRNRVCAMDGDDEA